MCVGGASYDKDAHLKKLRQMIKDVRQNSFFSRIKEEFLRMCVCVASDVRLCLYVNIRLKTSCVVGPSSDVLRTNDKKLRTYDKRLLLS